MPLAILVLLALTACTNQPRSPQRDGPLEWGLYQIHWGADHFERSLDHTLAPFPSNPDFVMFYRALSHLDFPRKAINAINEHGAVPIISLELGFWGSSEPCLDDILAGDFDDVFAAWARNARDHGSEIVLRPGFEMNGEWFSWSGDPPTFRKAWQHLHGLFANEGADNVTWFWCPNVVGIPRTADNAMHLYYPGDDVVDWIGLDGYNFGDEYDEWHEWESLETVLSAPLDQLAAIAPSKRIYIGETGSAPSTPHRKAAWIRDAHAWLSARTDVHGMVWFHYDKRREGEVNWRIDSSPMSQKAFDDTFAAPRAER